MLPPIEFNILQTLHDEQNALRAKEISALLDVTYQLVGSRTEKLQDMGFVYKKRVSDQKRSSLTEKAKTVFFSDTIEKKDPRIDLHEES